MALYRFGPFELDPSSRRLLRNGKPVTITTKIFETLVVLVENRGRLVTKDELLSTLWAGTTVEEANLTQNVSALRRALDDNPKDHRYIATISGRGYSFVALVTEASQQQEMSESPGQELTIPVIPAEETLPRKPRFRHVILWAAAPVSLICLGVAFFHFWKTSRSPAFYSSVPLTSYVGSESCPSFAPDGERVAFAWDGENQDNFDIYVKQIGDGTLLRLTSDPRPEVSPAWSPDGRTIAFLRLNSGDEAEVLVTSSVAAGPVRSLAAITAPLTLYPHSKFIAWSPDSKWLVLSNSPSFGGVAALFLLSVETGEKRRITQPAAEYDDFEPAFSLDMRHLAFVRHIGGGSVSDLYVQGLSPELQPQGSAQRLTFYNRHTASPIWTSDGKSILFTRTEQVGNHSIWRINLSDLKSEPVPVSADSSGSLDLSRQRSRLAYTRESSSSNIWAVDLPTPKDRATRISSPRLWVRSTLGAATPHFSPDGQRIAFQSDRSGRDEIWVCDRDGAHARQLTDLGAYTSGFPRWSPDGKKIVFHSRPHGFASIYVISAEGGIPERLGEGDDNDYAPSWSHDGKWIYFSSRRTGDFQVWKMPASGGPKQQVTNRGGWSPLESADGQYLYYIKLPQYALWRLPLAGGEESQVLPVVAGFGSAFAPGKEGIYYIRSALHGDGQEIAFLRFATGQTASVVHIPRPAGIGLVLSPDERLILYSQIDQDGSDLMLVENFH